MKFREKILFLFCFLTTSCQSALQYDQLADQEMFSFAKEVQKTNNLKLTTSGGGFLDCINSFSMTFVSPQTPSIDQARMLFFDISNRFLNRVNQSEALRPYLVTYPFTIGNLKLIIMFPEVVGYVTTVATDKGNPHNQDNIVYYFEYNPLKRQSEIFFEESYQSTLKIVEYQENVNFTSQDCP